jgi:hypothetical protein
MVDCWLGENAMSDTRLDQTEEILFYEISDEVLESAAGAKPAANYTLFYCTALDLCPGP